MIILSCDIDNTLTGDVDALQSLNETVKSLRKERSLKLIYNTGRGFAEFLELTKKDFRHLLRPDILIVAGGSEIYNSFCGEYILDPFYERQLTKVYEKTKVVQVMQDYDEVCSQKLKDACETDRLRHSITLHKNTVENPEQIVRDVRRKLTELGISAELVLEKDVEWLQGASYIDALPLGCSKASALEYVVKKTQTKENKNVPVIWCGDSRNDKTMLDTEYLGIIVGNAQDVLKNNANDILHYIADGKYASGVLEGLIHFGIAEAPYYGWTLQHRITFGLFLSFVFWSLVSHNKVVR